MDTVYLVMLDIPCEFTCVQSIHKTYKGAIEAIKDLASITDDKCVFCGSEDESVGDFHADMGTGYGYTYEIEIHILKD